MLIKIQPDATVRNYLFTAKSLYMFRVSQHPSSGALKTVTAASGTGHNIGTAPSLQRGLMGTELKKILTDWFSWNDCDELRSTLRRIPERAQVSFTSRRKPEMTCIQLFHKIMRKHLQ